MSSAHSQAHAELYTVKVSDKTTWVFLRLIGGQGVVGVGEATLNHKTDDVLAAFPRAVAAITACPLGLGAKLAAVRKAVPGVVGRALSSGLEQAWLDREGLRIGLPVHALLGGAYRRSVPCYANINRGTLSRTPEEFAERAGLALKRGYGAVKLAPFDGVNPDAGDEGERRRLIEAGLARVEAVVMAVDGAARVQVDCHSRFRREEAVDILQRLADLGVSWFEEPILEDDDALQPLAALRTRGRDLGVTLAGAEKAADTSAFLTFLNARCYDVVMPDIVLAGGPSEVVRIGHLASQLGMGVSLHNPCGPVMDMHSAHVAAALPSLHSLERQFEETSLYDEIVTREVHFTAGELSLGDCAGAGITLDTASSMVRHHAHAAISL